MYWGSDYYSRHHLSNQTGHYTPLLILSSSCCRCCWPSVCFSSTPPSSIHPRTYTWLLWLLYEETHVVGWIHDKCIPSGLLLFLFGPASDYLCTCLTTIIKRIVGECGRISCVALTPGILYFFSHLLRVHLSGYNHDNSAVSNYYPPHLPTVITVHCEWSEGETPGPAQTDQSEHSTVYTNQSIHTRYWCVLNWIKRRDLWCTL